MASIFDNSNNSFATGGSSRVTPGGNPGGAPNPFTPNAPKASGFSNPFAADGSNTENGFNTPGSGLLNLGQTPSATAEKYQISPEVQAMLEGKGGFSPETLAGMNANAKESAANAGQQQMAQVKRQEAQNGVAGSPAAAGYAGAVAKQTGQQQQQNLQQVQQQNAQAQLQQQNMAAQIEAQAGEGNMQSANQLALSNAQMLFESLLANQNTRLTTQRAVAGM